MAKHEDGVSVPTCTERVLCWLAGHTTSSSWLVAVPFFLLTMLARAGLLSSHTTSRLNPVLVAVSFLGEVAGLTPGSVVVTR